MNQQKSVIEEISINDINYELLKKQFPHAVSIDENGKYVIYPDKLQMSLDPAKATMCKEDGYGLTWVGKKEAYHNAFTKNYKVLKPLKDSSVNWNETENILIKGDNLDALKILRQNYFESIKMIYIDPPYNTKNDGFVYNDDFTTSTEQTLEKLGYDKEYIDYIENIQGAKTHSGWLSFMYPRLLLANDLLKNDGIIFISIDDNEVAQLKLLCDEVFGGDNFEGHIHWRRRSNQPNDKNKMIALVTEHILVYSKDKEEYKKSGVGKIGLTGTFSNPDNDPRGEWASKPWKAGEGQDGSKYIIESPTGKRFNETWMGEEKTFLELKNDNRIIFTKNGDGFPRKKYFKFEREQEGQCATNWWAHDKFGNNQEATDELAELFENQKGIFTNPKPTKLIKNLIDIANVKDNDIVLDFFAGSGSTGHAVFSKDEKVKFILVQLDEKIEYTKGLTQKEKEAIKKRIDFLTKLNKPINIFEITAERLRRAGDKINDGDIGFRTFEIVKDQKQKIYQKSLEEVSQDDLVAMMEKPDIESNEEILYNLFVAEALALSTKYEELIQNKLYLASNVAFILGDITSDELVEALKDKKECEYITVYSPNISNDKFTLEIESNISKLGIKPDKLRFRG